MSPLPVDHRRASHVCATPSRLSATDGALVSRGRYALWALLTLAAGPAFADDPPADAPVSPADRVEAPALGDSAYPVVLTAPEPGTPVASITFEGLRRVDVEAVRVLMTTRSGQPYSSSAVSEDIRALYGTGYFEDVEVYATQTPAGELALTFVVREKPSIRAVNIVGNDDLSNDDVKNAIDLRPFTIFSEAKVRKNVQKLKDLYVSKGYYLADVKPKVTRVAGGEVVVTFEIDENAKVQVREIRIVGNNKVDTALIKDSIATREGNLLSFVTDAGTYKAEAFQVDLLRISSLYFDRGFINVKVEPPDLEISADRKYLYITLRIEEGDQYSVGKLDFSGDLIVEADALRDLIKSEEGEVFNRSQLGQDLIALKTRYEDDGYAYANVTPLTQIDNDKRTISLTFDVQKGNKVYYERINVIGNTKTRDKVVRRELRIYEGELTSASMRELSRRRVQALGYFEKVEVKTRKGSSDDLQIVDIEIKERATGTFQVGAGLSSVENFIITAQIAQENFLGRGQSVALTAQISGIQQLFQLRFTEPYLFDSLWSLSFNAFNTNTAFRAFTRASAGGELTVGHPLFVDELRLFLSYNLEFVRSRGSDGVIVTQPYLAALNNSGRISSLRATITYDTRDNRLFPTQGMFHSASAEISDGILGASANRSFQRLRLINRVYQPLFWKVIGKASLRWGYINSSSETALSPAEKFVLGGIMSIRGYLPFSIGPSATAMRNTRGVSQPDPYSESFYFIEGGNKEFLANLEIEFPIFEEVGIRGVIFLDAGNAFAEEEGLFYLGGRTRNASSPAAGVGTTDRLNTALDYFDPASLPLGLFWSVGFGFRWFSPIGPLRFEWGIPLTPRPTDQKGLVFEFSIGNQF